MSRYKEQQQKGLARAYRFGLLGLALVIIILDQITKTIARNNLDLFHMRPFLKFWNWTLAYNQGAAFSLLANGDSWARLFLAIIAVVVAIALVYYLLTRPYSGLTGIALAFILGGAVGNLIDRIIAGKVTDFIDWYYSEYHWPAFNLADSFICIGVTLLIIENLFFSKHR
ncbi:MAG: signal peptidase II [Burkholderiales bacterium]